MKSYSSKEVIKILENNGWIIRGIEGSHHNFRHPEKLGKETIPHPKKDIPIKTLTIPLWLNEKAEREKINFSKTLQEALIEQLAFSKSPQEKKSIYNTLFYVGYYRRL